MLSLGKTFEEASNSLFIYCSFSSLLVHFVIHFDALLELDEVRIYPYIALHGAFNTNNSWAYRSVCSNNIFNGSLDFYLNFDECGGNSSMIGGEAGEGGG